MHRHFWYAGSTSFLHLGFIHFLILNHIKYLQVFSSKHHSEKFPKWQSNQHKSTYQINNKSLHAILQKHKYFKLLPFYVFLIKFKYIYIPSEVSGTTGRLIISTVKVFAGLELHHGQVKIRPQFTPFINILWSISNWLID